MLKVANAAHVDAVFLDAALVGSYTPGDAFALDVDDVEKIISVFHIDQWAALGVAISWGSATLSPTAFHCSDSGSKRSIWVALVARGSITLATTSDAKLLVQAARD